MVKAILFDMDGVLIDSEEYISKAAIEYFHSIGVNVTPEDFVPFIGAGENRYIGGVAEKYEVNIEIEEAKLATYAIYERLIQGKEEALPGVVRFIENAHKAGIPMSVATSADPTKMEINIDVMGLDRSWFKTLVHGKDIERRKPFPDIYEKAAHDMNISPQDCIVFEDATNGVEAAKRAGALCGAITTTFESEALLTKGADFIISGLSDFPDFSTIKEFNTLITMFIGRQGALQSRNNAYVPYSKYKVGASIVSRKSGKMYSGCNVENASYGATICAERGAIMKGVSAEGKLDISMVVVVTDDYPAAPPCAMCLQVLSEFTQPDALIYLCDLQGHITHYRFNELLPLPFVFPER
ncbi:MAG: cytidine deaminase [Spirochaetia bacterium]|nr:cytidine deaminase [Spirochaetia bacterium]